MWRNAAMARLLLQEKKRFELQLVVALDKGSENCGLRAIFKLKNIFKKRSKTHNCILYS